MPNLSVESSTSPLKLNFKSSMVSPISKFNPLKHYSHMPLCKNNFNNPNQKSQKILHSNNKSSPKFNPESTPWFKWKITSKDWKKKILNNNNKIKINSFEPISINMSIFLYYFIKIFSFFFDDKIQKLNEVVSL